MACMWEGQSGMDAVFFGSPAELRAWLEANHATAWELWIGFYKKGSGKVGITYAEALDEALCFGWIDGIRKRHDAASYVNRFTPRTARSTWSAVNIKRVEELRALGRLHPAGIAAFEGRDAARSGLYSHEQRAVGLDEAYEQQFRERAGAWKFWQAQPAGYRRTASWWVMSAKQATTRERRLATLVADSE